jgi:hypothetical protein
MVTLELDNKTALMLLSIERIAFENSRAIPAENLEERMTAAINWLAGYVSADNPQIRAVVYSEAKNE